MELTVDVSHVENTAILQTSAILTMNQNMKIYGVANIAKKNLPTKENARTMKKNAAQNREKIVVIGAVEKDIIQHHVMHLPILRDILYNHHKQKYT